MTQAILRGLYTSAPSILSSSKNEALTTWLQEAAALPDLLLLRRQMVEGRRPL